eukprot:TRINITY_DN6351_c0_g1_i1.p1 TRINITY_DN6351_c0_g1~~TRINITY_DN6351_c0_g1_i1.p1  ORF type:complete len:212 (-),score=63.94 TRINITY_DN6351_c0_g1_i1:100-735(-)
MFTPSSSSSNSSDPVVEVAVTHSEVPPGDTFTLACKIQPKNTADIGYLWVRRSDQGEPLRRIRVDHAKIDTSDNKWINIETQLNPGGDLKAFLAYTTKLTEFSPIIDIVLQDGEGLVPVGYIKHYRDVIRTAGPGSSRKSGYLAYKTQDSARFAAPIIAPIVFKGSHEPLSLEKLREMAAANAAKRNASPTSSVASPASESTFEKTFEAKD